MSPNRIRVQIADDHDVVIEGLQSILRTETDIEIVGPAIQSGEQLLTHVRAAGPDVLLLDVKMPEFDILTVLSQLAAALPRVRVIILTAQQDPQLVKAASNKGAAGYILKEEALSNLLPLAIREVAKGGLWYSPKASEYLIRRTTPLPELSEYQLDVLRLMVRGDTPEAIAQALNRSVKAIYGAQTQIREKLGVDSNEQAIIAAIRHRLVSLNLD